MASNNSTSDPYDKIKGDEEHILSLSAGRQLAYAHNGPLTSRTIILFFTGIMSVGTAANVPESCRDIQAHWISPTLPGMGNSSTRDLSVPYYVSLAQDMTALLNHLYPAADFDTLYLAGGSYGTVQAQMLYGAPYNLFPFGRKMAGCLLSDWGFDPRTLDAEHASKAMLVVGSNSDYIGGGTNDWLVASYKSATLKLFPGGHLSSLFFMDELWKELFTMADCK